MFYDDRIAALLDCRGWPLAVGGRPPCRLARPRQATQVLCHMSGGGVKGELDLVYLEVPRDTTPNLHVRAFRGMYGANLI